MPEITPAQELHEAARLMRKRAGEATEGPWAVREEHGRDIADEAWSDVRVTAPAGDVAIAYLSNILEGDPRDENAPFIASMHPGVALAVAALLDKIAWMGELDPDMLHRVGCDEAIAIARVFLGTSPEPAAEEKRQ